MFSRALMLDDMVLVDLLWLADRFEFEGDEIVTNGKANGKRERKKKLFQGRNLALTLRNAPTTIIDMSIDPVCMLALPVCSCSAFPARLRPRLADHQKGRAKAFVCSHGQGSASSRRAAVVSGVCARVDWCI